MHSHHSPSLLLSNEVRSTPWPDNIWDTSDQTRFFGGYNNYALSSEWVTRLLDPEYEGILILQSVVNCSPNVTVSNPRRPEFLAIPLWEPKTSQTGTKHGKSFNRTGDVCINIILSHICITTVAVQQREVLHILSVCAHSLSSPVRKVRAPYYIVICGWYGSTTFFHMIS